MTERFSKYVNTFLLSCHFEKHIQYIIVMRAISWSDMFRLSVFLSKSQNYSLGHLQHFSQHLSSIAFDLLHICTSLHYWTITSVDCAHQYQIWMAGACQGFSAQRDVASCRKRESRGKAKQDIFRSVRGAAPLLLSALGGKIHKRKRFLSLLLSPPFLPSPCSALLCLGRVLPSDTPLFPCDTRIKQQWLSPTGSRLLTATCFPQNYINSSLLLSTSC